MLLRKQGEMTEDHPTEVQHKTDEDRAQNVLHNREQVANQNSVFEVKQGDLEIEKKTMNTKENTTQRSHKIISKKDLKKRIKKLREKGLIRRKDKSKTKNKKLDCNEKLLSFEKQQMNTSNRSMARTERRKRSSSEDNLDYFSRFEVNDAEVRDRCRSMDDSNFRTEHIFPSMDSSSVPSQTSSDPQYFSDNNFDIPKRVLQDGESKRERSSSCPSQRERKYTKEDLKHKKERPKFVKRDSWFLMARKQKIEQGSFQKLDEQGNQEVRDKKNGDSHSEKQSTVEGKITQRKPFERQPNEIEKGEPFMKAQNGLISNSIAENRSKCLEEEKIVSNSSPKSDAELESGESNEHNENRSSQSTEYSKDDIANNTFTLLEIANQCKSKKKDAVLSKNASKITNEKTSPADTKTTPLLGENNEHEHVITDVKCTENTEVFVPETMQETETGITGSQEKFEFTSRYDGLVQNQTNLTNSDFLDSEDSDELLVVTKFLNDLSFIEEVAKKSLRSKEYLEKARKRYNR